MSISALFAPITLPLASLFAIPMLSSWSISLNLVFFSLTWTTIALTYTPLQLEFFAPLLIRFSLYLLPSALFLMFDLGVPSLAVELKAQGEIALPGRQKGGTKKIRAVVAWTCLNTALAVAIQAGVECAWSLNHLPNPWSLFKHAAIGLVSRNVLQYYIHLHILHSPSGGRLAYWHQTWHHSIRFPYSFAAAYDHPVCYILHRFVPLYLPAITFRFHIMTYILLLALFSLEELFTYSGYNVLPSTIMLRGMARRTDAHMMAQGKGNFGPFGVLDWAHGTTLGSVVMHDLHAEMDKHDLHDRAGKAVDEAGDAASGLASRFKGRGKKGRSKK